MHLNLNQRGLRIAIWDIFLKISFHFTNVLQLEKVKNQVFMGNII